MPNPAEMQPQMERTPTAKELVDAFKTGKRFFYREDHAHLDANSPLRRWNMVDGLEVYDRAVDPGEEPRELSLHTTHTTDTNRNHLMSVRGFLALQAEAQAEEVDAYLERTAARSVLREALNAEFTKARESGQRERSPEAKQRMFTVMYEPVLVRDLLKALTVGEESGVSFFNRSYYQVSSDYQRFQRWAAGKDTDPSEREVRFPGWEAEDFADMIKHFQEAEVRFRAQLLAEFKERGVDVEEVRALLARAEKAKAAMDAVTIRLHNVHGVEAERRV